MARCVYWDECVGSGTLLPILNVWLGVGERGRVSIFNIITIWRMLSHRLVVSVLGEQV